MSKSLLLKCVLLAVWLSSALAAVADGAVDIDAMVLSGNWQSALGTNVAISGCTITSAMADSMQCLASQSGTTSFTLDPSGLAQSDLHRALRDCSDYVGYPLCRVALQGKVTAQDGALIVEVNSIDWTWHPSD